MKTSVTLQSKDRELFGVTIRQDTKTSYLSVTDLQEAYTRERIIKGWSDKRIDDILSTISSSERIYYILEKQGFIKTSFSAFIEEVKNTSLVKVLKKYGAYKTTGARKNRVVMCNPYIWVLIAMELNPEIYATVITWLTDTLILNRIEVGDNYNILINSAYKKFGNIEYWRIAKALNFIIFGYHETMLRNKATQQQLKDLETLQKQLSFSIEMGYIKNFEDLIIEMGKIYKSKNITTSR